MRSLVRVAALGVSGVVVFKLATALVLPLLSMLFVVLALTVKLALLAALAYFVYSMLCKRRPGVEVHDVDEMTEVHEEVEIEVED